MSSLSSIFLAAVSVFSFFLIVAYAARSVSHAFVSRRRAAGVRLLHAILRGDESAGSSRFRKNSQRVWKPVLDALIALLQSVRPEEAELARIIDFFSARNADLYFIRVLRSRSVYRRCRAAYYLGYLKTDRARKALTLSLRQERKESAKLYLINALGSQETGVSLPDIVDSLKGCSNEFIRRITGILLDFQSSFTAFFPELEKRREPELLLLMVEFARLAPYRVFSEYLRGLLRDPETAIELRRKIFSCLVESYPFDINPVEYLYHDDSEIRHKAIDALGNSPGKENANSLIAYALEGLDRDRAIISLTAMTRKSAQIFLYLTDIARDAILNETENESVDETASIVNQVVLCRLDYFLLKLGDGDDVLHERIICQAMASGKTSDLVSFMNKNHDPEIESRLIKITSKCLVKNPGAMDEIRMYLKESVLQKLSLSSLEIPQKRINKKNESIRRFPLIVALFFVALVFPVIFFARLSDGVNPVSFSAVSVAAHAALNDYLFAFGWYAFVANFFYFFLAYLAWLEAGKQSRFLEIKDSLFLFRKNLLPSISILAPAYNEEASIVASVESLLNVNYPEFEVVVVNDGSKDNTLSLLIDHFKLERVDIAHSGVLRTQPVRAIYANPRIPELRVIDKINGGKADSLNVGLNAARMEYVLGIDSDSILERDALLTLASSFLDEDVPVVASGGNIMPVNGCTVDRGVLLEKRIPSRSVPLLQTIEYLRSFMNGRMGWARLDSLMIISGAFGLFRRENVLEINGYLTSREKYEKDTVGEDMELVVRLSRSLRERGVRHRILYHYKANCWTEVPSSVKILKRQRERWQRGLIDILSFHRTMLGNPRYGKYGLIGFPYFLTFEVIGPWFELLGTILFAVGIATGWIDRGVFRFLLASNFILSFALSATALFICDRDGSQFPLRDRFALVVASLVETLGFRQLMSFFRITGYIGVIRKVTGWGAMTRTGFTGKKGGHS